jgi:hypothetical protein
VILQFLTLRTSLTCASVYVAFLAVDGDSLADEVDVRECVVEADGCDSLPLAFDVDAEAFEDDCASVLIMASNLIASGVEERLMDF